MKLKFWQYILNTSGSAVSNVRIHVFLSDQVSSSQILSSTINNNIFIDIPDSAYAYIGPNNNTTVNNFNKSNTEDSKILTNSKGYFEFYISDIETLYPDKGYNYNQKFTIAWVGNTITPDCIENIDIFGIHYGVDENDETSSFSENKNKSISNKQASQLLNHISINYENNPHGFEGLDEDSTNLDGDWLIKNKLISNKIYKDFFNHINNNTTNIHNQYLLRNASQSMTSQSLIDNLNADLLDGLHANDIKNYSDNELLIHSNSKNTHGVIGEIVGTDSIQTLRNKTLTNLTEPLLITEGGTGARNTNDARDNLNAQEKNDNLSNISNMFPDLNKIIIGDGLDFIEETFENVLNDTFSTGILGGIGIYGTPAPTAQELLDDLGTFTNVSSGTDQITLSELNTKLESIHNKINNIINALKSYGILG